PRQAPLQLARRGGRSAAAPGGASARAMGDGDARAMIDGDARAMNDGDARAALVTAADYEPPSEGEGERETLLGEATEGTESEYDLSNFYDCDAALASWRESWPEEKQKFCCASEGKGCAGEDNATADAAPSGGGAAGDGWDPSWDEEGDEEGVGLDYAHLDIPKAGHGARAGQVRAPSRAAPQRGPHE
ncbi:unnamed protein product, partial [Prorocentrum cordatum]